MSAGRRHENKQRRKAQIVDAAMRLLESGGPEALTMRRLAAEAGVSEATPYNLFGSKADILGAVFERHFTEPGPHSRPPASVSDPLGRLLGSPHLVAASWTSRAEWFRDLVASARDAGTDMTALTAGPGALIRRDLRDAFDAGLIGGEIAIDLLVRQILSTNRGIYEFWAEGMIGDDQLADALTVSIATTLLGVADDELRDRLHGLLATIVDKEPWLEFD